jgi:FlaA1/EpsC-like NDP-sugar epimerase
MTIRKQLKRALEMPRTAKRIVALALDASICILTVWLALYLRLGVWPDVGGYRWVSVALSLTALPVFWAFGFYRAIFRYLGFDALMTVARACTVYGVLYASIFTFLEVFEVPRTVGIIQPILLFIFVASSRAFARSLFPGMMPGANDRRVLIFGAGSSGRQLASAIGNSGEMRVVGFVDDDPTLKGSVLNGRRIYAPSQLKLIVPRNGITDILLAMPSASRKRRAEILESLCPLAVSVRTLPGLMDLADGRVEVSTLRELDIEDLLGRDVAAPNQILFAKNILAKTVLVTGAGGSIGSELCRQIVAAKPSVLLLVEIGEYALYTIERELSALVKRIGGDTRIVPLMASVRDSGRLAEIMNTWAPDTVYHAAAYKHVPLVEHNPVEGLRNNSFGTFATARAAAAAGVKDFVLISTDKAVRPTNVMGTSKRIAELTLQALATERSKTRFSMVRFGNVLGSSGSVVPLFRAQIKAGGPITITHEDVTRYFMTIPEAAQLVIQAGAMASGGEVFILDMGEPVKIVDLARNMIELSGLSVRDSANPEGEVAIEVIGLRPGEKLYEELLIGDDPEPTSHPLIMKATERHWPMKVLKPMLAHLEQAMDANDAHAVTTALVALVPEYVPDDEPVDWIHLEREAG